MSAADLSLLTAARDLRSEWDDRWRNAAPQTRTRVQIAVFAVVVIGAYHYSLSTLLQNLNLDTPLAYIGLVPLIALALGAVRSRPLFSEPAIHDRQLDYIVGLPFLAIALAINLFLPKRLSVMFWVWRVDLLSFPFFVAGVIVVLFGIRALWRQRLAVAYLFLAWPVPYSAVLLRELNVFTTVTLDALHAIVGVVHVASPVPATGGAVFSVVGRGAAFQLSVVSACSGVNGMVGFLLVGVAFAVVVTGRRLRKAVWLVGGLFLLWIINLGRLVLIFWAGHMFGEHFAINVLHPFVGLVTFNIGIGIMLLLLKPVGLRIRRPEEVVAAWSSDRPAPSDAPPPARSGPLAVPAVYSAIALVVVLGILLGAINSGMRKYDMVASASGEPKLASYLLNPGAPSGWSPAFSSEYDWAKPYFGESSNWYRYIYTPNLGSSDLQASQPVFADVVNTSNLSSFSAFGVEACYRFHGYSLRDVAQVNLGGGITGQALSYATQSHQDWSIVYWIWPVHNGTSTRYERVILYMLNTQKGSVSAPGLTNISNVRGSLNPRDETQQRLIAVRAFLVAFARQIAAAQTKIVPGSRLAVYDPNVMVSTTNRPWESKLPKPDRPSGATATG